MSSIIAQCTGRWPAILSSLGINGSFLLNKHGPCPICQDDKQDRYRFDDKDGRGTYICSGCGSGDGMDLAMRVTGMSFAEVAKEIEQSLGTLPDPAPQKPKVDPAIRLRKIAHACKLDNHASMTVRRYLKSRGLAPALCTQSAIMDYWHDDQKTRDVPVMVHLVSDAEGNPATYHLTYLTQEGRKLSAGPAKKVMTPVRPWKGGAVRLCEPGVTLGIAEGIETALACREMFGIPVWAAINANNLEAFVPPSGVQKVVIFADTDRSFTGQSVAYNLARRLIKTMDVEVNAPESGDFADHYEKEYAQCS